jgi:transcriptional regulator
LFIPKNMLMNELPEQHAFIEQFGFALLVSADLQMTHAPLCLVREEGQFGTLYGHVARANSHWKVLDKSLVKAVFNGPHSYISPSWYATGPAVPTWNYAALHITGMASLLNEAELFTTIQKLVTQYEPALLDNETVMPVDYQHKLAKAIVGFKVEVQQIEGKHKLGQHKSGDDQRGTVEGLKRSKHQDAKALLAYMQQTGLGIG